jgi:putative membrane protein
VLAHDGVVGPHDLFRAWQPNLPALGLIALAAGLYGYGRRSPRPQSDRRLPLFVIAGLATLMLALASPLDTASGSLASAHMVQHLLITTIAVPLLILGHPARTMMRAIPLAGRWRRHQMLVRTAGRRTLRRPVALALMHGFVMWLWHVSGPYNAALESHAWHGLGHLTMFVTALAFWKSVALRRADAGVRILATFALALQTTFLSAVVTFARVPWYTGHGDAPRKWGLDNLEDQQLAGVIMWVPGGAVYVIAALVLTTRWIRSSSAFAVQINDPFGNIAHTETT